MEKACIYSFLKKESWCKQGSVIPHPFSLFLKFRTIDNLCEILQKFPKQRLLGPKNYVVFGPKSS
jgi:hypothetical protein